MGRGCLLTFAAMRPAVEATFWGFVSSQDAPDVFVLLRRLEIQSEAFLFYLYNPFG